MQVFATRKANATAMAVPKLTMLLTKCRFAVRAMKLTAILLLVACLQLSARGLSQTITLSLKDAPIQKVFKEIERQTDFTFFVERQWLEKAKKVTISVNGLPLSQVLELCFKDQPFSYSISGKTITLGPKKEKVDKEHKTSMNNPPPIDVKGRVVNSNGEPVANATIGVRGSSKKTVTNANGEFTLNGIDEDAVIQISHVQYEMENITLNGRGIVNATLQIKISSLDEMQVIAYGTTTKRLNTGNVASIKSSDIERQPVYNPLLALQGRVPGITITQATGFSGSGVVVKIQGQNSISTGVGNDPLYIIDGVPYPSRLLYSYNLIQGSSGSNFPRDAQGLGAGYGSPLNYINPADIESINVLKDADATAIYGSRAANGAIVITTKKGKSGQTKVDLNVQNGWGHMTRRLKLLNTQQYLEIRQEAFKNDNTSPSLSGVTPSYDLLHWDTTRQVNWQEVLLGGTANYTDIQATVSGGNNIIQFLVGTGFHKETTVFPGDFSDQKGSLHFNINNTSNNKRFVLQFSGNYVFDYNRLPRVDITEYAMTIPPVAPTLYNEDGSLNWAPLANGNSTWTNPLAYLNQKNNIKANNLVSNIVVGYNLLSNLEIKTSLGYTNTQENLLFTQPFSSIPPDARSTSERTSDFFFNNINSWIIEPQLRYSLKIGNGSIELFAGATAHRNYSRFILNTGSGYSSDQVMESISAASTKTATDGSSQYRYAAAFSRVTYSFKNKYIVNLSARRDGSSRFGSENQFHNFGSAAGAWLFSNEGFVQKTIPFISFGKIKVSYGTTGNDQIGNYKFLNLYSIFSGGVAYQGATGSRPTGLPNPYLAWEDTRKFNIGLDLGFFKDRILISADFYRNRSSNQLLGYTLPIITGFTGITSNLPAEIQNSGLELSLSTVNVKKKDFVWNSSVNLTVPKNKLIEYPDLSTSSVANFYVIGQPITIFKVYHFLGLNSATGIYEFSDGKGGVTSRPDTATTLTLMDYVDQSPKFFGGFQNTFRYRGFELDVLFQFMKQIGDASYLFGNYNGSAFDLSGNQPSSILNRWQKPGDEGFVQKYTASFFNTRLQKAETAVKRSQAAFSDASFIRLKNLSLSWSIPEKWGKKMHLQRARIYMQGQNILTITDYSGLDPETRNSTTLPPLRVITLGFQVTL